jgi:acyl carrier protein
MLMAVFLEDLQDLLQCDAPLAPDVVLPDLEEWDSLSIMSCMAYFDKKFGLQTKFTQYKPLRTVAELAALAGGAIK